MSYEFENRIGITSHEIENPRISLQRRLIRNVEVSPATSPNEIVSQRTHSQLT